MRFTGPGVKGASRAAPAAALLACLVAALAAVARAPAWGIVLPVAVAAACQLYALAERRAAERVLGRASLPGLSFVARLEALAARFAALEHRSGARHPVTGLLLRERLFDAIAADPPAGPRLLAVLRFADHDRLAAFDQPSAHHALARVAERLTAATSARHVVAQVDRDCFAIWFAEAPDAADAELRALLHPLTQELDTPVATILPAIEVGTALFPADGATPALLLAKALAARARPTVSSGGRVTLTAAPAAADTREMFLLEQGLALAIAEEQLTMLFQPLVDIAARRVVGAEALLRWNHATLGPVSPARFIPLVEQTGLSDRYGAWVLNAACREVRRWHDAGLTDLRVAVNLSACQLADPTLRDRIERTLARHRLAPAALELELTETAAMTDAARTLRLFGELRALGIHLAIDDFGSGHSSLSYLKNLPFDKLKIDREFVARVHEQPDSRAICRALLELGRGLGLRVLAEGVEAREEVDALARLGCTLFQGYFFARPLTGADFLAFARAPLALPGLGAPPPLHLADLEGRLSA